MSFNTRVRTHSTVTIRGKGTVIEFLRFVADELENLEASGYTVNLGMNGLPIIQSADGVCMVTIEISKP